MNSRLITILAIALGQIHSASATELDLDIKRALDSKFGENGFQNKLDACDMASAYTNHLLGEDIRGATNHKYIKSKNKRIEYLNLKVTHCYPDGYTSEAGKRNHNHPLTIKRKHFFQAEFRASFADIAKGGEGVRLDNIIYPCLKAYSAFFRRNG